MQSILIYFWGRVKSMSSYCISKEKRTSQHTHIDSISLQFKLCSLRESAKNQNKTNKKKQSGEITPSIEDLVCIKANCMLPRNTYTAHVPSKYFSLFEFHISTLPALFILLGYFPFFGSPNKGEKTETI